MFGTIAARFNDDGVTALYQYLRQELIAHGLPAAAALPHVATRVPTGVTTIVPPARVGYLADVAAAVATTTGRPPRSRSPGATRRSAPPATSSGAGAPTDDVEALLAEAEGQLDPACHALLDGWPATVEAYSGDEHVTQVRDHEVRTALTRTSLAGTHLPKVALPRYGDDGDLLRWLREENLPGRFPFTGGVFALKREGEDPTRMFAGEGDALRTNRRFHLLAAGQPATRLSTAFDSVTLYGFDPDERPDIYGKVGNSGVSIATLDDMRALYDGFDLCDPATSVSMTINGSAPAILAMFFCTAIDQRIAAFEDDNGRPPTAEEAADIGDWVLRTVRGTVQADILKEDQGQNTCIFSTEFALRMMADIQEWFVERRVRNFYSVSISGYHIAEAGANPITQLAFTLANAFTYVEAYLARGMAVDDFAPNLSFFFSNGMDPEYAVLGRVARRIWAVALRDRYGAGERSQKLKYHVQTSGRSLHAQEMAFNDIRTTLQASSRLRQLQQPPHQRLRRGRDHAVARVGAAGGRHPADHQPGVGPGRQPQRQPGLVRDRAAHRPGRGGRAGRVRPALLPGRGARRHGDRLPAGPHPGRVDAVRAAQARRLAPARGREHVPGARHRGGRRRGRPVPAAGPVPLDRGREAGVPGPPAPVPGRARRRPAGGVESPAPGRLEGDNLFAVLMGAVRVCSLGDITGALFEVGGRYRRNV